MPIQIKQEITISKLFLPLALIIALLATVPAQTGPYFQEDLRYGRTSSFGYGAKREMPAPVQADHDEARTNKRRDFLSANGLGVLLTGGSAAVAG